MAPGDPTVCCGLSRRNLFVGLFLVASLFVLAYFFVLKQPPPNGSAQTTNDNQPAVNQPPGLFAGWQKPEVVLVLSGQMFGYYQPCGCSHPQKGGQARRYNFIQTLKDKGWPVVALDVGDIAQGRGKGIAPYEQALLKYTAAMKNLKAMDYAGIGIGPHEFLMPFEDAISQYALNEPAPPLLAANLLDLKEAFFDTIKPWTIVERGKARVGVIGLVAPSVAQKVKAEKIRFADDNAAVLRKALADMKGKVDFGVVLYQGRTVEPMAGVKIDPKEDEALSLAKYCEELGKVDAALPRIHVILARAASSPQGPRDNESDEPPSQPVHQVGATQTHSTVHQVGGIMIVSIGHKGRYMGVVGASRAANSFELRYQLVPIGPEWETPKGRSNPVMEIIQKYAEDVKSKNLLAGYSRHKHPVQVSFPEAEYVGSAECKRCHGDAYKIWEKSGHAHAYKALEKPQHPSLRQYDGECIVCHVVGFQHPTGYLDKQNDADLNVALRGVGCESCHGPGSAHIQDRKNQKLHQLMNPWKYVPDKGRMQFINDSCMKCHDPDNDVHWDIKKWVEIAHPTPRENANAKAPAILGQPAAQPEIRK